MVSLAHTSLPLNRLTVVSAVFALYIVYPTHIRGLYHATRDVGSSERRGLTTLVAALPRDHLGRFYAIGART